MTPIVVIVGESLLVRDAAEEVRSAVLAGPAAAFNHAVFTAGEDAAAGFAEAANTVPMMAALRLVEVRQVQDAGVALLDALLAYAASPCPSTVLLVTGEKLPGAVGGVDRGARLLNAVRKTGEVRRLGRESVEPVRFAQARAKALGVRLERDAAEMLVQLGGGELAVLAADVDKCAAYAGEGGTIDVAVATEVCASIAEAGRWALTEAIVARDRDRALETLHRKLEEGEPPHLLLGQVAWQLRQVLLVQDAEKRGLSVDALRMRPEQVRAIRERVRRRQVSPSALLEEIAAHNRAMNSSRAGDRRVFEALVLRLVSL